MAKIIKAKRHDKLADMPSETNDDHDARYYTKDEVNDIVEGNTFDFFLNNTNSDISSPTQYFVMDPTETGDAQSTFSDTITNDDFLIDTWATSTSEPTFSALVQGIYAFHIHAETTTGANVSSVRLYWELYRRTHPGGVETLIITSEQSNILTSVETELDIHGSLSESVMLDQTDRLVLKVYANIETSRPTDPLVTLTAEGTTASHFEVVTTITAFDDRYVEVMGDTMKGTLKTDDGSILATDVVSGVLTLGGIGGSNNEDLTFDFEGTANAAVLGSSVGTASLRTTIPIRFLDNVALQLGDNSADLNMVWETTGNDNLQIGTPVGAAGGSGYISIMERGDMGNANRSPLTVSANPVLRVYSSDGTEPLDYIEMYHDQQDSIIGIGGSVLNIKLNAANSVFSIQAGGQNVFRWNMDRTAAEMLWLTRDNVGNQFVFSNYDNRGSDHDHDTTTDPTLFIHSDTDPDTDNTQWMSMHHNKIDGVIALGKGNLKLSPSATGNVTLFEDIDIGEGENGRKLIVHRKSAAGDTKFEMNINQFQNAKFFSNGQMVFDCNGAFLIQSNAAEKVMFFSNSAIGDNREIRQFGYITAASSKKYIQWRVSDSSDNFELTRVDANIQAFDIQMPVLMTGGNVGIGVTDPETLLELTSTQPYLTLHNNTHEDTNGGRESRLNFKGEQGVDPFEETTLARIEVSHDGTGADDKGKLVISTNDGADADTPTAAITIDSNQNVFIHVIKSGTDQANAGAGANELWKTSSHATLPDNVVLIGI